jgi:hypothetical protein
MMCALCGRAVSSAQSVLLEAPLPVITVAGRERPSVVLCRDCHELDRLDGTLPREQSRMIRALRRQA